jgi:hypothetical protein
MPIEVGIWRIDGAPKKLHFSPLKEESKLENVLDEDIGVLDPSLMVIGRQVPTAFGKFIDILAMAKATSLSWSSRGTGRRERLSPRYWTMPLGCAASPTIR